jgi:hypothetical protein
MNIKWLSSHAAVIIMGKKNGEIYILWSMFIVAVKKQSIV